MKTRVVLVIAALLCTIGITTVVHADSSAATPVAIEGFDDQASLANWQAGGKGEVSLETNPKYVRVGTGSLKFIMRLDPTVSDVGITVTNAHLQVSGTPLGISFWVYPVNTNSITVYSVGADGNGADWDLINLKMDEWNLVRCYAKDAVMDRGGKSTTLNGIKSISIGAGQITTWLGTMDPDQPAICYFDDVRAMNSDMIVDPYETGTEALGNKGSDSLEMGQEFWKGQRIEGTFTAGNPSSTGPGDLDLTVLQGGNVVCSLTQSKVFDGGSNAFQFCISRILPEGEYEIKVSLDGRDETRKLTILGESAIQARRKDVESYGSILSKMIEDAKSKGEATAYAESALAVADRFLRIESPDKIGQGKFGEAGVDLERCKPILTEAIERLKNGKELEVPAPSMEHLTVRDGSFYSGNTPVALLGPVGWSEMWEEMASVYKLGFNYIDDETGSTIGEFQTTMTPPGADNSIGMYRLSEASFDREIAYPVLGNWELLKLENIDIAVSFNPGIWYVPKWVQEVYPELKPNETWKGMGFNAPMEYPSIRSLWETYYDGIIPLTKNDPHLLLYWLKNEPMYWSHTPRYLELFHNYLQDKYKSVEALNKVWQTSYTDFQQAEFPEKDNKAAWYDWNCFHFNEVTDFFAWQRSQVKKYVADALTSSKPIADGFFDEAFGDTTGIDWEGLANLYEVPGCDTYVCYSDQNPTGWLVRSGTILYDFWKSVAPNKPIANTEFHYLEENPPYEYSVDRDQIERYVQVAFWQQYLHGARLNAFWWWRNSKNAGRNSPATGQPTVLYSTAKAALDIRRLSKYISLFPSKPEVAIYYSKPSVFLGGAEHLVPLDDVYTGVYFLDAPIGFVTDKMLLKGVDKRIKFIIIPQAQYATDEVYQALEDYAKGGGKLFIIGENSLSRDEKNQPRDVTDLKALPDVQWIEPGQTLKGLWKAFDQIMDQNSISRPVRVMDDTENPVWEIESRTVEADGKRFVYLINMSTEDKKVQLEAKTKIRRMKDLISEETVKETSFLLRRFEVKFLELE